MIHPFYNIFLVKIMNSQKLLHTFYLSIRKYSLKSGVSQISGLGKKKTDLTTATKDDLQLAVEKDVNKLLSYVCGTNLLEEGGEDIKIKPDSAYPDWLWRIGKPPSLDKLDRSDPEFWRRVRNKGLKEKKYLDSLKKTSTVHK